MTHPAGRLPEGIGTRSPGSGTGAGEGRKMARLTRPALVWIT